MDSVVLDKVDVDSSGVFSDLACRNFSLTRFTSSLLISGARSVLNFLLSWLCQVCWLFQTDIMEVNYAYFC